MGRVSKNFDKTICRGHETMSSIHVSCPFEDCKLFGIIEYVELNRFMRHLVQDHDRDDLLQLAFQKGIIQDPTKYHNHSYIIQKIAKISIIRGGLYHGSN